MLPTAVNPERTDVGTRRRTAEALVAALEGEEPAPAQERLVVALVEAHALRFVLQSLSRDRDLGPEEAAGAEELARGLGELLTRWFPQGEPEIAEGRPDAGS